mgnify:CR=1 FL=1
MPKLAKVNGDYSKDVLTFAKWNKKGNHKAKLISQFETIGTGWDCSITGSDISKDGMLEGPSIELYKTIIEECSNSSGARSIKLIASGGVSEIKDLEDLDKIGCEGVIIGKAIYENKIGLDELRDFINS